MANQVMDALVYTNDKCVGCNKCISACPVLNANHAVEENGRNKIIVDGKACISCGACAAECPVSCISEGDSSYVIDESACIECGSCASVCPVSAPEQE